MTLSEKEQAIFNRITAENLNIALSRFRQNQDFSSNL